jgi:selenide,water dikinase
LGPKFLAEVLKNLPVNYNPNLLVGFETSDDAGIYKISDRQALVQTVDFFPPIVDDPYAFGQIAAANALSDIYAMGGKPLTALNIVAFPLDAMPPDILIKMLLGGAEKIKESGAVVIGGHSIKDKELKYGLAVTGIIDIDKIIKNSSAKIGDVLLLTKPLGTGIITTAIKRGAAGQADIDNVTSMMTQLNQIASELMVKYSAHAATDITGFGLLGHSYEMAAASGVTLKINFACLPLINNVIKYSMAGNIPGGLNANREYLQDKVQLSSPLDKAQSDILFDPQTSGGLLISIPSDKADSLIGSAAKHGLQIYKIGEVIQRANYSIVVD